MGKWSLKRWRLLGSVMWLLSVTHPIAAQVIPDAALPAGERSQVTGNPNFQIDGGARRGGNLFHSFSQFSIRTGGSAYFNNAADVQNIFSRVTGGSISNINGVIRANGTANLFLLNPNGILFGPNASLNIGGSFVATTANAIGFPNDEVFSSDATQPSPSQLLTMNPNALLFNQLATQTIVNQSIANNRTGLQVPAGQSLLLVGGNVRLEGGRIVSPGSRVELGAVAGQGSIDLNRTAGDWRLIFPDGLARADVSLSNSAWIDIFAGGGGSIAITAKNITLNQGSNLRVGINDGAGFTGAQAGELRLDATETINLAGGARIRNDVRPGGTGNAGDINITTGSLFITGSTSVISRTYGQGNAGNITVNARDRVSIDNSIGLFNSVDPTGVGNAGGITINTGSLLLTATQLTSTTSGRGDAGSITINARDGISMDGGAIFNTVQATAIGNASGINITTDSLALKGGIQLISNTSGRGNAGSITINARDRVSIDGSAVFNTVEPTAIGNASGINITTDSLALTSGARLITNTSGRGNVGSITINARDRVSIDGSAVFNTVEPTAIGNASGINITTDSLALTSGARLITNTSGRGNVGSVNIYARDRVFIADRTVVSNRVMPTGIGNASGFNITTDSLVLTGGSQLVSVTNGRGNAGSVNIYARNLVSVDGESFDTFDKSFINASGIFTRVEQGAVGLGGDVTIATGSLFLTDGGAVNTANIGGTGNAGRVTIQADSVQIRGTAPSTTFFRSGVFTSATPSSVGNGGDVSITTGSLSVSDQGRIITNAEGQGSAGKIQIQASGVVSFDGGDAISTLLSTGTGRGGDINITGRSLSVLNNAQLAASTSGDGNAGNITVSADTVGLSRGGQLLTTTSSSNRAGDITVKTPDLQLSGATSGLFAGTTSAGDAGNLTIQSRGSGQSVRVNLQDSAQISASTSSSGRGGQLTITAPESITLTGNGSIIAAGTGGNGAGGDLRLQTNTLTVQDQAGVTVSSSDTGNAGSLFVDANRVVVNSGGSIRAGTSSAGRGGQLTITAPESITLTGNGSVIAAGTGGSGAGGNLNLRTGTLNIQNQAEVTVSSGGTGSAGSLFVNADRIYLSNQGSIRADTTGGGGNINLRSPFILLRNGSNITTNATGSNISGGNIAINTQFLVAVPREDSNISANSEDFRGGNVNINAFSIFGIQPSPISTPLSDITATGATFALSGTIDITTAGIDPTSGLVALPTDLVDSAPIAQGCAANQGNSFVITGRGGLPPTPEQQLDDDAEWGDRRRLTVAQQTSQGRGGTENRESRRTDTPIIEATGWQITPAGAIFLVATTPTPTVQNRLNQPVACQGR